MVHGPLTFAVLDLDDLDVASDIPWLVPASVVAVVVSLLLAAPVARRLATSPFVGWLVVVSVGLIVAATLTPLDVAGDGRTCDLSRLGLAPFRELRRITDTSLNIVLFLPLGAALAVLPAGRVRMAAAGAAVLLPFAVEAVQWLVPALGRGCQSADVVDNLTGLAIGAVAGFGLRRLTEH